MRVTRACIPWILGLLLATTALAWAQAGPDGAHQTSVGPGAGLESGASPTGAFAASIPLDLPPPRGHLPIPVSIVYTGSTRAGAAGAGWGGPISDVRRSHSSWRRFPGGAQPGTETAAERLYVSIGGGAQL